MKKQTWYIIAIVVVVLIIFSVYFYFQGKRKAEGPKVTYPQGGSGIPAGWSPEPLVARLYDAMSGLFTFTGTKDAAWRELRDLPSDDMVTAVYDVFNQKYYSESQATLTQWIRDENYFDPLTGVKETTIKRLENLRLA